MQRCMTTSSRRPGFSTAGARSRVRSAVAALGVLVVVVGAQLGAVPPASAASLPGPLHTDGRWIVNEEGRRVKLAAINWSGAETQAFVGHEFDLRRREKRDPLAPSHLVNTRLGREPVEEVETVGERPPHVALAEAIGPDCQVHLGMLPRRSRDPGRGSADRW